MRGGSKKKRTLGVEQWLVSQAKEVEGRDIIEQPSENWRCFCAALAGSIHSAAVMRVLGDEV